MHIHLFPHSFWPVVEVQHHRTLLVVFQGTSLILRKSSSQNGERSLRCCSEGCNRDTNYAHANQSLARWQSRTTAVRGKFYMWQRSSYIMEEHLLSNHERCKLLIFVLGRLRVCSIRCVHTARSKTLSSAIVTWCWTCLGEWLVCLTSLRVIGRVLGDTSAWRAASDWQSAWQSSEESLTECLAERLVCLANHECTAKAKWQVLVSVSPSLSGAWS